MPLSMYIQADIWSYSGGGRSSRASHQPSGAAWYNPQGRMNRSMRTKIHCYGQKQLMVQCQSTTTMQEHSHLAHMRYTGRCTVCRLVQQCLSEDSSRSTRRRARAWMCGAVNFRADCYRCSMSRHIETMEITKTQSWLVHQSQF